MIPYLFLIGLPALASFNTSTIKLKSIKIDNKKIVFFFFFFVMFLMLAFRGTSCGSDTGGYVESFQVARMTKWKDITKSRFEIGYVVFEKICSIVLPNAQLFLAVVAFLCVTPILYLYAREAELPYLTIILFTTVAPFTMYFSGIRQALAMAFVVPAWYFTKQKKLIFFILTVILATLFHNSAVAMVLLYPFYWIRITPKWLWMIVPAILMVFLYNRQVFRFLAMFLGDKYSSEDVSTGAYNVLLLLVLFAIFAFIMPDEELLDRETVALRNLLILSIFFQCFAPVHYLAMRVNYYYLIFIPLLISRLIVVYRDEYQKLASVALMVLASFFTVYFYYNLTTGTGLHIYPYLPFWSS